MFSSQSSHQSASEQKLSLAEMGLNFLEEARQEANEMNFGRALKCYQQAIEKLNQALQVVNPQKFIKPSLAQAYFEQGQLLEQMQKTTQAQECYQKAKDLGHRQPSMQPQHSSQASDQKHDTPDLISPSHARISAALCKRLEEQISFIQAQLDEARKNDAITQELVSDLNRLVSQGMQNNPGDLKAHDNLATLEKNLEQLKSDLLGMEQELKRHASNSKGQFLMVQTDINRRLEKLDQVLTETFIQLQQQISKRYALLTPREEGVQLKKVKDFLGVGTSHSGIRGAIVYKKYLIFKIYNQHDPVGYFLRILDMQSGEITQEISLADSRGDANNHQFVISTAGLLVYGCYCIIPSSTAPRQWICSIRIWDIIQNKFVKTLEEILLPSGRGGWPLGTLSSIAALPDNRLASFYNNDEIKIWDLTELKLVKIVKLTTPESGVSEQRRGRELFALSDGSLIRYIYNTLTDLWDVNDLSRNIKLNGNLMHGFNGCGIVEMSGNQLATCIWEKDGISIFDLETGLVKRSLSGHSNMANVCGVQDQFLISVDGDTIRLWDAHTGKCLNIFPAEGINYFIKDPESNHLLAIKNCDVLMLKVTGLELQEGKENKDNKEDKNSNQRLLTGHPPSGRFSSKAPLFSTSNSPPSRSAPTSNSQSSVERKKSIFSATLGEGQ